MKTVYGLLLLFAVKLSADSSLVLHIDYAGKKETQSQVVQYAKGMSALEVLQSVADVKIKRVGEYNFVTSINGIKSKPGKMGWFYKLNGKNAAKTASSTFLVDVESMRWEYRRESCSSR